MLNWCQSHFGAGLTLEHLENRFALPFKCLFQRDFGKDGWMFQSLALFHFCKRKLNIVVFSNTVDYSIVIVYYSFHVVVPRPHAGRGAGLLVWTYLSSTLLHLHC